jgi:hypothetical protein
LKGKQAMDEPTLWKSLIGLIGILFVWNNSRVNSAHDKIDEERIASEERNALVYAKIAEGVAKTEKCRDEIKKDLEVRMKAPDIKEYVGMSIRPLENKIDALHIDVKSMLTRNK